MEKVGVLGSGDVGKTLANGFKEAGYHVMLGTRDTSKVDYEQKGTFEETAKFGDIVVLAVKGTAVEDVIRMADPANFDGKIVIDVTNPLVFEEGKPPKLAYGFPESSGKKIQEILQKAKVVKAFNIVTAKYMCKAKLDDGTPDMFIAGDDDSAKAKVKTIAENWGWPVTDLGSIDQAYLLEALAMVWITYGFKNNYWTHAFKLLKK